MCPSGPCSTQKLSYEYESFCVLQGPEGHMQGHYEFIRPDGTTFRAAIPRFLLRIHQA